MATARRRGNAMMDQILYKTLTEKETAEIFENAEVFLPPLSKGPIQYSLKIEFTGKYDPHVYVFINDDGAETAWRYDFTCKTYSHAGYGPGCFWTEEEAFYQADEEDSWDENWD